MLLELYWGKPRYCCWDSPRGHEAAGAQLRDRTTGRTACEQDLIKGRAWKAPWLGMGIG